MSMKIEKQFVDWIKKQIKIYKPILGLDLQNVDVERGDCEFMDITCAYPYIDNTIKYSDKAIDAWRKGELLSDRILHELCHIITDPLYCKAIVRYVGKHEIEDERENLTDKISIIIRNLI